MFAQHYRCPVSPCDERFVEIRKHREKWQRHRLGRQASQTVAEVLIGMGEIGNRISVVVKRFARATESQRTISDGATKSV